MISWRALWLDDATIGLRCVVVGNRAWCDGVGEGNGKFSHRFSLLRVKDAILFTARVEELKKYSGNFIAKHKKSFFPAACERSFFLTFMRLWLKKQQKRATWNNGWDTRGTVQGAECHNWQSYALRLPTKEPFLNIYKKWFGAINAKSAEYSTEL